MNNAILALNHERQPIFPIPYKQIGHFFKERAVSLYSRVPETVVFREKTSRSFASGDQLELKISFSNNAVGLALAADQSIIWVGELDLADVRNPYGFTLGWINKIKRLTPVQSIVVELFDYKFDHYRICDDHLLRNPRRAEVVAFLMDRYQGKCVYCGQPGYEIEHIIPKHKKGGNRITNLTLACRPCNQKKGGRDLIDFINPDYANRVIMDAASHPIEVLEAKNMLASKLYIALTNRYQDIKVSAASTAEKNYNLERFGACHHPQPAHIQAIYLGQGKSYESIPKKPTIINHQCSLND